MIDGNDASFTYIGLSDEALCSGIRAGESKALSVLLHRYSGFVMKKSKAVICRGLDCDDLYQEGMISLIHAAVTFDCEKKASFKTYACVCILNRFRDLIRKSGGDPLTVSIDDVDLPEEQELEDQVIARDELERLRNVMESDLSAKERGIILDHLSGLSYAEIAQKHGCDVKSVNNALCRVRKKLKQF